MVNINIIFNKLKNNLKKKKNFFFLNLNNFNYKIFKLLEIYKYINNCFILILKKKFFLIIYLKYINNKNISFIKNFKIYNNKKRFISLKKYIYYKIYIIKGLYIISTSKGLMSLYKSKFLNLGGILICYIY